MDRAGLSPNDGPTHHGLFDVSYLNCIPNAVIMQPRHENELQDMLYTSVRCGQPAFIRYPRGNGVGVGLSEKAKLLEIGKAEVLTDGDLGAIWALGDFVEVALDINSRFLKNYGQGFTVVNARFIKPIDEALLLEHADQFDRIFTLEDGVLKGGFGSTILELLSENKKGLEVTRFGWPDEFIPHGDSVDQIREDFGLDADALFSKISSTLPNSSRSRRLLAS